MESRPKLGAATSAEIVGQMAEELPGMVEDMDPSSLRLAAQPHNEDLLGQQPQASPRAELHVKIEDEPSMLPRSIPSRPHCQSLLVKLAVIFISFAPPALPLLFLGGQPFLGSCPAPIAPSHAYIKTVIILAPVLTGPLYLWLRSAASTEYLKQVARYLCVLWAYSFFDALRELADCHGNLPLAGLAILFSGPGYIFGCLLCVQLALGRLKVLEAHMLKSFHYKQLRWAIRIIAIAILPAFFLSIAGIPIMRFILLGVILFLCAWVILLLRAFGFANSLVHQAAAATSGSRQAEAKRLGKTATVHLAGLASTLFTMCLFWLLTCLVFYLPELESAGISESTFRNCYYTMGLLDQLANCVGALAFSGALTGAVAGGRQHRSEEVARLKTLQASREQFKPCDNKEWNDKVKELAERGISLSALIRFYRHDLRQQMPNFDPARHRTSDVVRCVIIPLSRLVASAYATVLMDGRPTLPNKMVTHNWGNLFRDLVAAIVADALSEDEYEEIANLLDRNIETIEEWIAMQGVGERTYWICAFSVDQHAGICGANPHNDSDPISGAIHKTCDCGAPKFFNDAPPLYNNKSTFCEMNKFDHMMAYLSAHDANFEQVIAVDAHFDLFTRAWCVSELAKAFAMGMKQNLKLLNVRSLQDHKGSLEGLRIENMEATRPEDIAEILADIPDKDSFNNSLQKLIFHRLIPQWNLLDALDQMVSIARVARWQSLVKKRGSVGIYSERQDGNPETPPARTGPPGALQ